MAQLIDYTDIKTTYATRENAIKAFQKKFGGRNVRFLVVANADGRFTPVALGQHAMQEGVHFHFPVAG